MARGTADESTIRMVEAGDNANTQDERLLVRFYLEAIHNEDKSKAEGRPVFEEIVMVSITAPGWTDHVKRPAWEADYQRFPKQLAAFKSGQETPETGTPLKMWPLVTVGQVAELNYRNIRTVEQLAAVADVDATKIQGAIALRQSARDFLEAAKGAAPMTALRAELEARDSRIAAMEAQMAELVAHANKASSKEAKK